MNSVIGIFIGSMVIGILIGSVLLFLIFYFRSRKLREDLYFYKDKYGKLLSQKKSSEVRVGKIGENMAPFMNDWPYDPNNFRFLGNPVDGIQFTNDEIIFVEIKTGKSRLTKSQKTAREIIRNGKVKFATFRIDETGSSFVLDDDEECE